MHSKRSSLLGRIKTFFILAIVFLLAVVAYVGIFGFPYPAPQWQSRDVRAATVTSLPAAADDSVQPAWLGFLQRRPITADLIEENRAYGPLIRWHWPGNSIALEQLRPALRRLVEDGFSGVEIQPLARSHSGAACAWLSTVGTESHYYRLASLLQEADSAKLRVDLSALPSPLLGGDFVSPDDNMRALAWNSVTIPENGDHRSMLPQLDVPRIHNPWVALGLYAGWQKPRFNRQNASLLTTLAVKKGNPKAGWPRRTLDPVWLNFDSVTQMDGLPPGETISWPFQEGEWLLIGNWITASGESIPGLFEDRPTLVIDYFDVSKVRNAHERLFGAHTLLPTFYGQPMGAATNSTHGFQTLRPVSRDLMAQFQERRGYRLEPWLPVLMPTLAERERGGWVHDEKVDLFSYGSTDDRVLYDYRLTMSELFIERFIRGAGEWLQERKLAHRIGIHGAQWNIISAAGSASLPEIQQHSDDPVAMAIARLVSSGAFLHNRPLISAHAGSVGSWGTTPADLKRQADYLMTLGVNHMVYLSSDPETDCGQDAVAGTDTSPPRIPYSLDARFDSHQGAMNRYLSRVQLLMRTGPEKVDVLIYYPFLGDASDDANRLRAELKRDPGNGRLPEDLRWLHRILPVITTLEDQGLRWAWVDDESLQNLHFEDGNLVVRGNTVQAVLIARAPHIQAETASWLYRLDNQGADVQILGPAPARQVGWDGHRNGDAQVGNLMYKIQTNQPPLDDGNLSVWARSLAAKQKLAYSVPQQGMRRITRRIVTPRRDGKSSFVHFFFNNSERAVNLALDTQIPINEFLWFEPMQGTIIKTGETLDFPIGPFAAMVLLENAGPFGGLQVEQKQTRVRSMELGTWQPAAGNPNLHRLSVDLEDLAATEVLLLDPGSVQGVGYLRVNGEECGTVAFWPFHHDLSNCVKSGRNLLELTLVAPDAQPAVTASTLPPARLEIMGFSEGSE